MTILIAVFGILKVTDWAFARPQVEMPQMRLHIQLLLDQERTYSRTWLIDPIRALAFEANPDRVVRAYQVEAQRSLALRRGYRPALYGSGYHRLVRVLATRYRLEDREGRTLLEGVVGRTLSLPPA